MRPPPAAGQVDPNALRLLISYDNDPHATHIPSRFQVVNLAQAGLRELIV